MHAAGDKGAVLLCNSGQRALDAVENILHDARAQRGAQRRTRAAHGLAHLQACGVLIHLDGRFFRGDADDLANEPHLAYICLLYTS